MNSQESLQNIENKIKELISDWAKIKSEEYNNQKKVQYSGPKFSSEEYVSMMDAIFSNWWSGGRFSLETESKLASISNRKHALLCNSGSSANLLLMSAAKELYFENGDKIVTLACGFPTTINPIIQNNLIPVFVDIDLDTLNISLKNLRKIIQKDKDIKGVFIPHTLGFAANIEEVSAICSEFNIKLFWDCCDAYGTTHNDKYVQAYGDGATFSFYTAHHLSCGEGGAIVTNCERLNSTIRGFRNWGRWCAAPQCCIRSKDPNLFCPSKVLTPSCDLPEDYSVNYRFEWMGYNLKMLEIQAAILDKQLDRIGDFNQIRKNNYSILYDGLKDYIAIKTWKIEDNVSPFAFPILFDSNQTRSRFNKFMANNNIETRLLFAGNVTRHPAFRNKDLYDIAEPLNNSDIITERFAMVGVSQINDAEKTNIILSKIVEFINE